MAIQQTIANPVSIEGIGLHSGENVKVTLKPAEDFDGIVFHRLDVQPAGSGVINLCATAVHKADLCTQIRNDYDVHLNTIEHLMAALFILRIDNVIIEVEGAELPILDGSSAPWLELLDKAGIKELTENRKVIKILNEVKVEEGNSIVSVKPAADFSMKVFVHYGSEIPPQSDEFSDDETEFRLSVGSARTFCLEKEIEYMKSMEIIKGGSLDNALVIGKDGKPLNEGGMRFDDEPLAHKALDAMGDLYVSGYRIIGAFNLTRPGHTMNNMLLRAILENPTNWKWA